MKENKLDRLRDEFKFFFWKWMYLRCPPARIRMEEIALEINNLRKGV